MKRSSHWTSVIAFSIALGVPALLTSPASAGSIVPGRYKLGNHPAGEVASPFYGLRLNELFDVRRHKNDVFTFDFEREGAAMWLDFDGDSIHIWGTAFGGLDKGDHWAPAHTSWVEIDFTYDRVQRVRNDDDLIVKTRSYKNEGTIEWLATGETIDLLDDRNGNNFTFRFGDRNNDRGHRGFDGLSGWGWLVHGDHRNCPPDGSWLFTAHLIPLPPALLLGAAGLAAVALRRRRSAGRSHSAH